MLPALFFLFLHSGFNFGENDHPAGDLKNKLESGAYYVSASGNDNNPGTLRLPLRTIKKAYGLCIPGDTVFIRAGIYTEYHGMQWGVLGLDKSGTAGHPIVIMAYRCEKVVLDGQNINDEEHRYIIRITGNYNIIDGLEITRGFLSGIENYGSSNQVRNCNIHHNGNTGISASQYGQDGIYSGPRTRNNSYTNNYIHNNGRPVADNHLDHGLYLCGDDETVTRNVITGNAAYGIQVAGVMTVSNIRIYNNVLAFNGQAGIVLWLNVENADIRNNIFFKNNTYGIRTSGAKGHGNVIDFNLFYHNAKGDWNLLPPGFYVLGKGNRTRVNPLFMNDGDFTLKSKSPAIDAGIDVGLPYLGKSPDMGPFEKY